MGLPENDERLSQTLHKRDAALKELRLKNRDLAERLEASKREKATMEAFLESAGVSLEDIT